MAAADQQFLDALKYLGGSLQQFGISRAVNDANQQAQEIKNTMTDDLQRRQALTQLAQSAATRIAGAGGTGQQVQAVQNLAPQLPTSAENAVLMGQLTGEQGLANIGRQAIKEQEDRTIRGEQRKASIAEASQMRLFNHTERVAMMKAAAKAGTVELRGLTDGAVTRVNDVDDAIANLRDIQKDYAENKALYNTYIGPLADSAIPSFSQPAQVRAFTQKVNEGMIKFRHAMTGAAGSARELAELKDAALNLSLQPEQFEKVLNTQLNKAATGRDRMLDNYGRGGFDVRGFRNVPDQNFSQTPAAKGTLLPPTAFIKPRTR